jgi:hypothetical protein
VVGEATATRRIGVAGGDDDRDHRRRQQCAQAELSLRVCL